MKRYRHLLIVLLALVLGIGIAAAICPGRGTLERVYTVAAVRAGLAHHPEAWVGRAVQVQGAVQPSGCVSWDAGGAPCHGRTAFLLDRDGVNVLQVAGWGPDPLLATLRRLPLVGWLVPGPQTVRWGIRATYQARLLVTKAVRCGVGPCYAALLLDAAPDALEEG